MRLPGWLALFNFAHHVHYSSSLPYTQSSLCCNALRVSGQSAGAAGHSGMGTYIVQKENADSHCVYEKEDAENAAVKMYLYHTSNDGGDQWIIGTTLGGHSGRLYVNSDAKRPSDIAFSNADGERPSWWASGASQWHSSPNVTLNCTDFVFPEHPINNHTSNNSNFSWESMPNLYSLGHEDGSNDHTDTFLDHELVAFKGVHFGCAPWLRPNGLDWNNPRNVQNSLEDCEKQCRAIQACKYGTYMTHGERRGECWLAAQTAPQQRQCSTVLGNAEEICTGFHLNVDLPYQGRSHSPVGELNHSQSFNKYYHAECEEDHFYWGLYQGKPLCESCTVGKFSAGCGSLPTSSPTFAPGESPLANAWGDFACQHSFQKDSTVCAQDRYHSEGCVLMCANLHKAPAREPCVADQFGSICKSRIDPSERVQHAGIAAHVVNNDNSSSTLCEISSIYGEWSGCSKHCAAGKKYRYKEVKHYTGVCHESPVGYHTSIETASCNEVPCSSKDQATVFGNIVVPPLRTAALVRINSTEVVVSVSDAGSLNTSRKHCEVSSIYGQWSGCSKPCNIGKKYRYKEVKRYAGVCGASNIRHHTLIQTGACNTRLCTAATQQAILHAHVIIPPLRNVGDVKEPMHTSVVGMSDSDAALATLGEPAYTHMGLGTTASITSAVLSEMPRDAPPELKLTHSGVITQQSAGNRDHERNPDDLMNMPTSDVHLQIAETIGLIN